MRVRPGDRVAAGQPLAAGLPLRFARYRVGDAERAGVPSNLQPFTAPR